MNKHYIPTPQDEELRLEENAARAANHNGTAFDHGGGFSPGGVGMPVVAVVNISAADRANGDETYTFVVQESADNVNYADAGPAVTVDVDGTSATLGAISVPAIVSQRYVRLKLTVGGTTPSITYEAWLNPNLR